MPDLQIATTDGGGKMLEDATIQAFRAELRGRLLSAGHASYDDTRKVWNGMIDRLAFGTNREISQARRKDSRSPSGCNRSAYPFS